MYIHTLEFLYMFLTDQISVILIDFSYFISAIGEGGDVDNKDIQGLLNDTGKSNIK